MKSWEVRIRCKDCNKKLDLIGKECEDLFWTIDKRGLPKPFYYCKKCLQNNKKKK